MSLNDYSKKRDFSKTPEPPAKPGAGGDRLIFVVQKHAASQLHYDLRLEAGGVLKSWAVPKGPSMNPGARHLAIMVEDHPYDYKDFEGVIEEGNYGAGTVMIWDKGMYTPAVKGTEPLSRDEAEAEMQRMLEKGHLSFILNGSKLHGEFALVKMRRAEENAWLLIKAADDDAKDDDVLQEDRSAETNRSMDEIAQDSAKKAAHTPEKSLEELGLADAPKAKKPYDLRPMLATAVDAPFSRPGWLFEIKWDGYRAMAEIHEEEVYLYSRNQKSFNLHFPPIVESLKALGGDMVLDGEVAVLDEQGHSNFQLLQNYLRIRQGNLVYYVFDLPYYAGRDLRGLPLHKRREVLSAILTDLPDVKISDFVEDQGEELFRLADSRGLEGVVAKLADSSYRSGDRGRDWLKVRSRLRQEFVIGGYTEPRGGRKRFGALLVGEYSGHEFVFSGHVGSGLDDAGLEFLWQKMHPLERPAPPFEKAPKTNEPAHWVEPLLVCEVEFHGYTEAGLLRQPVILGLREDKSAEEVRREMPEKPGPFSEKPKDGKLTEVGRRELKLTNLNKIFWPEEGYTKGDLIDYYREVAPVILPHLRDRPQSLNRYPDGITGENFYQKNITPEMIPDWIETVKVPSSSSKTGEINFLLCQEEAALVFMINLGCIELNPWSSRASALDNPDYIVIDLDPLDVPFSTVVKAALAVHDTLEGAGIKSFPKTSGATGLHIYIPLGAKYSYQQGRDFAKIIAQIVHEKTPDFTSIERSPAKREGKVYLDYLQNARGQTLASAYSVRPMPGAPVSTPLTWDEVNMRLSPRNFTIRNTPARIDKVGDIFRPVLGPGINIEKALVKLG